MTQGLDILVQGLLLGGLYAISAIGLSLVFGVMRLVNLAHGDLMIAAVYLAIAFTFGAPEAHPLILIAVALAFAPFGYALQRVLLNRVLDPDPLRPLLVTFGLSVVLQNLFLLAFTADTRRLRLDALTEGTITLGPVSFGALDGLILITAIALAGGLQLLFFRSSLGRRLRAASDDVATLGLMGLNPRHVFALASAIAFVVIAIAGLLLALRSTVDPFSGPGRLLVAFEAVIIGGLGSFWGTLTAAMLIGVAQVIAGAVDPGWQAIGGHVVFLIVLALRPQGLFPEDFAMTRDLSTTLSGCLRIALVVALLAILPAALQASSLRFGTEVLIFLSLAMLWNLLAGYAGLVSVGQQALVGLGAYAGLIAMVWWGWPFWLAIGASALAGGIAAAFFSVFLFRLQGPTFAIGTWVMAEMSLRIIANTTAVGGGGGASVPAAVARGIAEDRGARESAIYWTALTLAGLVLLGSYLLMRSRWGLALMAMRDEPIAAETIGIDTRRVARAIFLGVAVLTGAVGGVILMSKLRITPDSAFSLFDWTAYTIFIVVIGGIGRLEGPIVGTAVFFGLRVLLADYGPVYLIVLGCLAIAVMLFAPRGLWGAVYARTRLRILPAGWPSRQPDQTR